MLEPKRTGRVMIILAVGALVLFQPASFVAEASPGRDYSRCITSCNHVASECRAVCQIDCSALFPPPRNDQERAACINQCRATCDAEREECELICEAIKPEASPSKP